MQWRSVPHFYAPSEGGALKKLLLGLVGAVGSRTFAADSWQEFKVVAKRHLQCIYIGLADATDDARLGEETAAFGAIIYSSGEVNVCTRANAIRLAGGHTGRRLRGGHAGVVTEIHVAIQDKRVTMSFNEEAPIDLGHDLPARVAPWICIVGQRDEVDFEVILRQVPLQIQANLEGGAIAFICRRLSGEVAGKIEGLGPEEPGSALAALIYESVEAPHGAAWKLALPNGKLLVDDESGLPLHELFEFDQEEVAAAQHAAIQFGPPVLPPGAFTTEQGSPHK